MDMLLALLPFALIASFTPGPNNILVMNCGISRGLKATLPYQLGAGAACFILIALCIQLGATLEQVLPVLLPVMRYAGGAYMLWLAYVVAFPPAAVEGGSGAGAPGPPGTRAAANAATWRSGFLLQFVNPKFYLYILTLAAVLGPTAHSLLDVSLYGLFFAVVAVAGMWAWAAAGAGLQRFLNRWHRQANMIMGLALVWCAWSLF